MFSTAFLGFYAKCCPIGPNETFVILLGSTQTAAAAGGCGVLLLEDYLIPKLAMCALWSFKQQLTLKMWTHCNIFICSCTTWFWFLDLIDLVGINRVWVYKEPKFSVLQVNAKLVQKGECSTWNQRSRGSTLTRVTFSHWNFLFSWYSL